MASVSIGQAIQVTGQKVAGAVDSVKNIAGSVSNITNNWKGTAGAAVSGLSGSIRPDANKSSSNYNIVTFPNVLEKFASYSALWTLSCITPTELNNPLLYRREEGLKYIVFSSAGRSDANRVKTFYGTPEYFINNFIMKTVVAGNSKSGNSNAVQFEWDIYEPYSMGLLLQSLQNAAKNAGYLNYLNNAPFVLRLDFLGFGEDGRRIEIIKPKYFVLKLTKVTFSVTESGSTYKMLAVPYNHQGFSDDANVTYNDIKLVADSKGGTVSELLTTGTRSLCAALNGIEKKLVDEKKIKIPDIYDIQFPESFSDFARSSEMSETEKKATMAPASSNNPPAEPKKIAGTNLQIPRNYTINAIGKSDFGYSQADGGNFIFKLPSDTIDEKTGLIKRQNMLIDPTNRAFQFAQGQTILAMINQIILSSEYVKKALTPGADGMIDWWRIDVQIELRDYDDWIGDFARKYTYRVVPYKVHHSIFSNPNSAPIGYQDLAKKICKKYSYIYTGENVDIIKFDINIDNLFYTGINSSAENETAKIVNPNDDGTAEKTNLTTRVGEGTAKTAVAASLGRPRVKKDPELLEKPTGGSGVQSSEQKIAEAFHQAFVSKNTNMVKVNLEILGDPYWMVDSGMGNYFSASTTNPQITADGTMNYESGDIYVYLTFRTPSDINEATGLYNFALVGKESPFSGIYRVTQCENQFNEGRFTQKLTCVRMPGQALEFKDLPPELQKQPVDPATSSAIQTDKPEKPPTSPIDDSKPSTSNTGTAYA